MTVADAIREATTRLAAVSDTARLDAELLMAHALECSRSDMLLRAMNAAVPSHYGTLVDRRAAHEPVAYITGQAEFYGLELQVSPDVLIPRGDSETLIDAARDAFANRAAPSRIIDLGTGSGALLLAALSLWPQAQGVGFDASMAALKVADCNARKLGMAERCTFVRRSWRKGDWQRGLDRFDLVLCNPPYVEDAAELAPQVRDHEPKSALFSGPEGLDDYRILLPQVADLLTATGIAIFEIGATQQYAVAAIARNQGLAVDFREDLAGIARAITVSKENLQGVGKAPDSL